MLAQTDDRRAIRSILGTLHQERPEDRDAVFRILAGIGDRWALQLLVTQLEDSRAARRVAPLIAALVPDPPTAATQERLGAQDLEAWREWAKRRPQLPAALSWDSTSATIVAKPEDDSGSASFAFRNVGTVPIEILAVQTACSCTTPTLERTLYDAGDAGRILVSYDFGISTGAQTRKLTVFAMPVGGTLLERHVLELHADLPALCACAPRTLSWKPGEAGAKTVDIDELPSGGRVDRVIQPEAFACELAPLEVDGSAAGHWRLTVTPKDPAAAATAIVPVVVRFASGKTREQPVWVYVRER